MKKQFIIEITETNHPIETIYNMESYTAPGFYLNTTSDGQKQLLFKPSSEILGIRGIFDNMLAPELMEYLKPVMAADEAPQVLAVSAPAATVTNAELMRFIAIARNPDLITEIIKKDTAINKTDE